MWKDGWLYVFREGGSSHNEDLGLETQLNKWGGSVHSSGVSTILHIQI